MNVLQMLNVVSGRAGQELTQANVNGKILKDLLLDIYNLRLQDFNARYEWPWREKTTTLQTIANYTDGTVTVENGSRSVTNGTGFTTAMKGRFLKLTRDNDIYEILDVPSSSTLTLKEPYIGEDGSGLSFLIWNRYYNLPPDVPMNAKIILWKYPYHTTQIPKGAMGLSYMRGWESGYPSSWSWGRVNRKNSVYSVTTSVATTANSKVLTGTATTFIGNVFEGSLITVGVNTYNVESVDSDLQITMVQNATQTVSSQNATFDTGSRQTIMLSSTPDPVLNLNITYPKQTYNLKNDNDTTEIWPGFEHIIENAIYGELLDKLTSDKAFQWLKIYEGQIQVAWNSICNTDSPETATLYSTRGTSNYRSGLYG